MLDNGWDTAPDFAERIAAAETAIAEAERDGRPVSFVATAEPRAESLAAGTARRGEAAASRRSCRGPTFPTGRRWPRGSRRHSASAPVEVVWVAGALDGGDGAAFAAALEPHRRRAAAMLQSARPVTVMRTAGEPAPTACTCRSSASAAAATVGVAGFDQEGRRILEGSATLDSERRRRGRDRAAGGDPQLARPLPRDRRSRAPARCSFSTRRWQRKSVGLIAGEGADASQPLLEPLTYVERALAPTVRPAPVRRRRAPARR